MSELVGWILIPLTLWECLKIPDTLVPTDIGHIGPGENELLMMTTPELNSTNIVFDPKYESKSLLESWYSKLIVLLAWNHLQIRVRAYCFMSLNFFSHSEKRHVLFLCANSVFCPRPTPNKPIVGS